MGVLTVGKPKQERLAFFLEFAIPWYLISLFSRKSGLRGKKKELGELRKSLGVQKSALAQSFQIKGKLKNSIRDSILH